MTKTHLRPPLLLALATLALGIVLSRAAGALENLEQFPRSTLSVEAQHGQEWFSIWIADSPARSEQGLMYLKWLPEDQGMLFPQAVPRVMSMWMKNTLIPLDMLFIDEHGRVVYIRERATPQSEAIISTPLPVKAVLELAGGLCAKLGIKVGDKVHHAIFGSAPAGPVIK